MKLRICLKLANEVFTEQKHSWPNLQPQSMITLFAGDNDDNRDNDDDGDDDNHDDDDDDDKVGGLY